MTNEIFRNVLTAAMIGGAAILAASGPSAADDAITATVKTDPALHALLPKAIQEAGVIKLGTDAHFPPYESFAKDGVTMIGWEPDLWDALGKKLGVAVKPSSIDFDGLLPGVKSGRFDMAMEGIGDTLEREKQFTFIDIAISTSAVYALEDSKITADPLSLCGLKTATQKGTSAVGTVEKILQPLCAKAGKPAVDNKMLPTADATLLAALSGRVDFVLNDAAAASEIRKQVSRPIKVITMSSFPKKYNGMVVNPEKKELAEALLAATKALIADGTYDRVMDKWELGAIKLKEPGLNLASTRGAPK